MSSKTSCNLIQNKQLLLEDIPTSLQKLSYGIYPDSNIYNDKRFIYNKLFNYFPHVIFYPRNNKDISYLIKEFVFNKCKFTVRCGGHSYEPASLSSGYIIDVSNINKIKINNKNKTAEIGSGSKLGDIVSALKKSKLVTAIGDSSCVGISGLSLAGGKGLLTRVLGMVCDNIISLDIVNYEGKIMKIDKDNHSDLFWACKGSGTMNYGVICNIELKLYSDIYFQLKELTWTLNHNNKQYFDTIRNIFILYQKWILISTTNITTNVNFKYNNGVVTFTIKFYKFGENELFNETHCFEEIGVPEIVLCDGWVSQKTDCWFSYSNGYSQPFSKIKSSMIFEPNYTEQYINIYINSIENLLNNGLNIVFQYNFTQVGGHVINGISAYFPKDAIIILTILCTWEIPELTNYCQKFMRCKYDKIIKYTSDYVFPNMVDYDLDDYMKSYYGDNENKLIQIKSFYDPNNIFNWFHSIPVKHCNC